MNRIRVSGIVAQEPEFSHTTFGEDFYKFYLMSVRTSGVNDIIPCIVPESLEKYVECGSDIDIVGEVRTRNVDGHMEIQVFVLDVNAHESNMDYNYVEIEGYVCKQPVLRETPLGRVITDIIIASNRERVHKSDYIPCIVWGRNAQRASEYEVGTKLNIVGRLQSREYTKRISDTETETRTAYEVSISKLEAVTDEG